MLEKLIEGLSTPCEVLRKKAVINLKIDELQDKIPNKPGFFRLGGVPYWLDIVDDKKIINYIYVLGKPPYMSMPSERMPVAPETLRSLVALTGIYDLSNVDKIVAPEAMGFHVGGVFSILTDIPFVPIAREGKKKRYVDDISGKELEGRISFLKSTGYETTEMSVYGVEPGETVLLLDTIISTGGTGSSIINGLREHNIEVRGFGAYVAKMDYKGIENIEKETGITPKPLINLWINDVYLEGGKVYADTRIEKSKWWDMGERAVARFNPVWEMLKRTIYEVQLNYKG